MCLCINIHLLSRKCLKCNFAMLPVYKILVWVTKQDIQNTMKCRILFQKHWILFVQVLAQISISFISIYRPWHCTLPNQELFLLLTFCSAGKINRQNGNLHKETRWTKQDKLENVSWKRNPGLVVGNRRQRIWAVSLQSSEFAWLNLPVFLRPRLDFRIIWPVAPSPQTG